MVEKTDSPQADKSDGISKIEAVRRALAELGNDAKPAEIQPFVKQKFGIDMTPEHVTTCKGTILKTAGKSKPAKAAPKAAPKAAAAPQQANGKAGGLTKMEAVKRAMAALGKKAKPLAIKDYLKSQFNIEISRDVVSNYKKQFKKGKGGAKAASARTKPAAAAPLASPAPAAAKAASPKSADGGVTVQDLGTIKDLVGRVGADTLRTLIDLFAR